MSLQDPYSRRDMVQTLNAEAIARFMAKHKMTVSARSLADWRPTRPVTGCIAGVWECVTIIATNGVLAWFEHPTQPLKVGHVQCFDGKIEPLYSSSTMGKHHGGDSGPYKGPRKPKTKPLREMSVAQMRKKMLEDL